MTLYDALPGGGEAAKHDPGKQPGCQLDDVPRRGALRLVDTLRSAIGWSLAALRRWRRRRATIRTLQTLSDHHLTDIGFDRAGIAATVEQRHGVGG